MNIQATLGDILALIMSDHEKKMADMYLEGKARPHYPLPAKKVRTFEYWRNLGYVSALNNFDVEIVQYLNRYR